MLYDSKGTILETSPISPKWWLPMGTDTLGADLLMKTLDGAKYTILITVIISFLQICLSLIIGCVIAIYCKRLQKYLNAFSESFHYIPLTLIAVYVLHPVLYEMPNGFLYTFTERIVLQVLLLTLLALPMLTSLFSNEIGLIEQRDFIQSSKILGSSNLFLIRKHILPHLKQRIFILFGQQMIQVLIILAHLGIFKLFLGGTKVSYERYTKDPPRSITNDWSGLIGDGYYSFVSAPWVFLSPILFFTLSIIAINLMIESYKQITSIDKNFVNKKRKFKKSNEFNHQLVSSTLDKSLLVRLKQ